MIRFEDLGKVNAVYIKELESAFFETMQSGRFILGNQVSEFENEFSLIHQNHYCLGVASGLDALILGLSSFEFPPGAKVLVPSNTYIACILAIIRAGLVPVLVEPNVHTCNIDAEGLEKSYTHDCVAIMAVHLYGRMCEMPEIMKFTESKGLKVLEDCSQSHFAEINGTKAGCFGDIGAFSFYPTKNLGALGDGGAIICKNFDTYEKLKAFRNYGSHVKYDTKYLGWNSRLDEMQAAFLRVKLRHYTKVIEQKRILATRYFDRLKSIPDITLPLEAKKNHVWHIFNIKIPHRNELRKYLFENGIETEIHYPIPPHQQEAYKIFFQNESYPISEKIHKNTLSLPISVCHNIKDINKVADVVESYFR